MYFCVKIKIMKKYFNTTGFCRPDWHYMVNPIRGLTNEIYHLIENNQYFLIHAPRQSGKTSLLHALTQQINSEGKYIAVTFSMENAGVRSLSLDKAMFIIIESIYEAAKTFLPKNERPPEVTNYTPIENLLFKYLTDWSQLQSKAILLFIDEIDSIWDDILIITLRQLRNGFQFRPKNFPASIALVGLRDIREYKNKVKALDGEMGSGSPFNVKAESFFLKNFTKEQITQLFQQYTDETGQKFSEPVIDSVHSYTGGQPWLVNAMANEITVKILKNDYSKEITTEIVEIAKENLIIRRDTHLDSLMDKLKEPRVKNIVQSIISGDPFATDSFNDDLQYTLDLGIVIVENQTIKISNKIYTEVIPRVLNYGFQCSIAPIVEPMWFIKNGKLEMNLLLKEFQQFYRENAESWIDRFSYKECGQQLLLMAFLQRIINGGGRIDREMALGRGRTDLLVAYASEKFVLELKIKNKNYTQDKSCIQLSRYIDTVGLSSGYLIAFEPKLSTEVPWEERIKWNEIDFEWQAVKRKITIVEL